MLPNSDHRDLHNSDSDSLRIIIELLMSDLKEANNKIMKLTEENSNLKAKVELKNENSWHTVKPNLVRNHPNPPNFVIDTSNRYSVLNTTNGKGSLNQIKNSPKNGKTQSQAADIRKKILIMADSHGRGIAANLLASVKSEFSVTSIVKPGAKTREVLANTTNVSENLKKEDAIVIISGSNDVARNESKQIIRSLAKNLPKLKNNKVCLIDVPKRHDLNDQSCVNLEINNVNKKLKKLSKLYNNIELIETGKIDRKFFTNHGQHLNNLGKELLSDNIMSAIATGLNNVYKTAIPLPHYSNLNRENSGIITQTVDSTNVNRGENQDQIDQSKHRSSTRVKKPSANLKDFLY